MKCNECGEKLSVSDNFCQHCGTRNEVEFEDLKADKGKKKKIKKVYLMLWMLFFFPVGLFLMWKQNHFPKAVKIIITSIYLFISLMMYIGSEFGTYITVHKQQSYKIEYYEPEPDYKLYFSIQDEGEDIIVTDSMITEDVNPMIPGVYTVELKYLASSGEELIEVISITVVENDLYIDHTTLTIEVNPDNLETSFTYMSIEPQWQNYFEIRAYGEDVIVTDSMITEDVNPMIPGVYTVELKYLASSGEELREVISITVVENDLYIDHTTVTIKVNPDNLETSFTLMSIEPQWQNYFEIRAYGEDITVVESMITETLDFTVINSGVVTIIYDDGSNVYTETLDIEITTDPIIAQLMSVGFTYSEAQDVNVLFMDMGITDISNIVDKQVGSIDSSNSYDLTANGEYTLHMIIENRLLSIVRTDFYTFYTDGEIQGHIDDFDVQGVYFYTLLLELIGFVDYNGYFVLDAENSGKSISFDSEYGIDTLVYEYESNVDYTVWSYYPNLGEGYIEGWAVEDYCGYDTVTNTYITEATCSQDDLDILLLLISIYEQDLASLGTSGLELNDLIYKLYLSKNLNE